MRDCKTWEEIEFTLSEDDPSLETVSRDGSDIWLTPEYRIFNLAGYPDEIINFT